MHDRIFQIIVNENEITWQTIITDLVKKEDMDPWDVDVSDLSNKYIQTVKKLKDHDFRVSGKVVLAAAILLKIKSNRFVDEDMLELDRLINQRDMTEDEFYEEIQDDFHIPGQLSEEQKHQLIPKTPQPRVRKVSIYDLMDALDQALEVRRRRIVNSIPQVEELHHPEKKIDLTATINNVYKKIRKHYDEQKKQLTFSQLIPSEERQDKIYTFVPLLHLENLRKINLDQEEHLGEIGIQMHKASTKKEVDKELAAS